MRRKERTHLVGLAALVHDVGKVGQRAQVDRPDLATIDTFCPLDTSGSGRTHLHAAWTGKFIEDHLKPLWDGQGDPSLLTLAARHHDPSTPLDGVVAEADRLASGMDRSEGEERLGVRVSEVLLVSVLSRVRCGREGAEEPRVALLPTSEFSLHRRSLFPSRSPVVGASAYAGLWNGLIQGARDVCAVWSPDHPDIAFHAALHLLERYGSSVPASALTPVPDISLFDHARSASAIAACMAWWDQSETDLEWVRDRRDPRYALACIDISGIQPYIHALKSDGARKSLTGRSFYIQLLQDALASGATTRLDLPPSCVLFQGGGKVWLLLPSEAVDGLRGWVEEVDLQLWQETGGLLGVAMGAARLSGQDLVEKRIGPKWGEALHDLQQSRLRRMASLPYEKVFSVQEFRRYDCAQCDRETDREDRQCSHCHMTEKLGQRLGRSGLVYRLPADGGHGMWVFPMPKALGVKYAFPDGILDVPWVVSLAMTWPTAEDVRKEAQARRALVFWPVATSEPIEFERLARQNPSVPRIGVLRADVDNLGLLFQHGFPPHEQSLSRLSALSRSLGIFFGAYLPDQIRSRWPHDVRIVFSGGDDCFLVGSFSAIPELARWLRKEFGEYGANNSCLSLSAGIAIQDERAPILATARRAARDLEVAKHFTRAGSGMSKDAVTFFGMPLSWTEMDHAGAVTAKLVEGVGAISPLSARLHSFVWSEVPGVGGARLPRSVLQVLGHVAGLYRLGQQAETRRQVPAIINSHRWMWIAHYALVRAAEAHPGAKAFLHWLRGVLLQTGAPPNANARGLVEILPVIAAWSFLLTRPR